MFFVHAWETDVTLEELQLIANVLLQFMSMGIPQEPLLFKHEPYNYNLMLDQLSNRI